MPFFKNIKSKTLLITYHPDTYILIKFQRVRLEQDGDGSTLVLGPAEPGDQAVSFSSFYECGDDFFNLLA